MSEKQTLSLSDFTNDQKKQQQAKKKPNPIREKAFSSGFGGKKSTELEDNPNMKTVDPKDIAPRKKNENMNPEDFEINKAMDRLDVGVERLKNQLTPIIEQGKEIIRVNRDKAIAQGKTIPTLDGEGTITPTKEMIEEAKDRLEERGIEVPETKQSTITMNAPSNISVAAPENTSNKVSTSLTIEEDDEVDEDNIETDIDEVESEEERARREARERRDKLIEDAEKQLLPQIQAVIKPVENKTNLSMFKIRTKPIAVTKALSVNNDNTKENVSDWVLPNTGVSISMREFSGSEIEMLNPENRAQNLINTYIRIYSTIYRHVVDPNKPKTLEEWVKKISVFDIRHLMFAVYKASYEQSNYIPYFCQNDKCNKAELIKVNIDDMVEFGDEETKAKFKQILEKDTTSASTIEETLVQLSDNYAVGLATPSIYKVIFENAVLENNDEFYQKYSDILSKISFITNFYTINYDTQELVPIDTRPDSNDLKKTVQNKVKIYNRILNTLTSDQYFLFEQAINDISMKEMDITYIIPEHTCTKCGTKIEKETVDPLQMVFIRHRLTRVANSLKSAKQ